MARPPSLDAENQLARAVAALCRPDTYPEPVRHIESIETHMSWVFLTEAHAYKLKKPIRTPHLDHTTVAVRRRACHTELRLNRRLAPDVYLAVVPLTASDGALRVAGPGVAVDWLVKMRRLPHERMLDRCVDRCVGRCVGQSPVLPADIDRLAAVLVDFYAAAERAVFDGAAYRNRILADIESKRASLEMPRYGLRPAGIRALVARQRDWLARHGPLLEARAHRVVDAHGDLRPEHICLEPRPVIIDCLEFDRDLRLLDPVSELSFLALECRRLGASWIGKRLLARYAERACDPPPAPLIPFYQSHHALVRAAVAIWHLDDPDAAARAQAFRARSELYLRMAHELLD